MTATGLRYGTALRNCATGLRYGKALRDCATELRYGTALRNCAMAMVLMLVLIPRAYAQKEPTAIDEQVEELAEELRCPVCQGLSIADSPSELSQQMKDVVRGQLESGKSPDEVKAYFVSKYGEWILLTPKPAGMNLAVYLAPLVLLLGGGGLIVYMVRKWSRGSHSVSGEVLDEEEALL